MEHMPHYARDAIEREVPGEVKTIHAREREAVVASFDEDLGYFVSYIELVGPDEKPSEIAAKLRWQERFYENGLNAGLRFSELEKKLPPETEEEKQVRRNRDPEKIPRWTEVEDFLFS